MSETIHLVGDVIGHRYEILAYVGEGGMQEVYRAKDLLLSREVALKAPKNDVGEEKIQEKCCSKR